MLEEVDFVMRELVVLCELVLYVCPCVLVIIFRNRFSKSFFGEPGHLHHTKINVVC